MSMLAERKIKHKWSLNPRGKEWSEDTSKFGFKMLEKMGWSKGKGLGVQENGRTDHVKVSYKNDSQGFGFKENEEQWTEHDDQYNAFLQTLNGDTETNKINLKSLEHKSIKSKVRVHYHKFIKGKDLSKCTEKDLASIFGKKNLNLQIENTPEEQIENDNKSTETDIKKKKKRKHDETLDEPIQQEIEMKKKKKKSKEKVSDNPNVNSNDTINSEDHQETLSKKKKKKHKNTNDFPPGEYALENPGFTEVNGTNEPCPIPTQYEVVREETPRKKKHNKTEDSPAEIETKKKKKNKSIETAIDNPVFDEESPDLSQINNCSLEVKKKKKKKSKDESAIDNPIFTESADNDESFNNNTLEVKRKKKKKDADDGNGLDNPTFNPNNSVESEENYDLLLNVTTEPVIKKDSKIMDSKSKKNRKSVTFSKFNEEHIIPSREESMAIEENINSLAKKIDNCEAEVENDLNEKKNNDIMIGSIDGNSDGTHKQLPDGTLLRFKLAKLSNFTPSYFGKDCVNSSKRSYKHLIKGDITVAFKNTNLHAIDGYATNKT